MTAVATLGDDAAEEYADLLTLVARALATGDVAAAAIHLAPIAGQRWTGRVQLARRDSSGDGPHRPRLGTASVSPAVYLRDKFRCSYCGGRAVPRCVLVAISDVFPRDLPYNRHYAAGRIHPVYWALACEADHTVAHSRGGGDDLSNLTTMHAICNTRKADSAPNDTNARCDLDPDWDGLLTFYPDIVKTGDTHGERQSAANYHREWLRRFKRAGWSGWA